ncbi:unnamed protein product [Phytophthora lilii]|uniref:Unnamed protein product n=1 Tax=Phytophthora lilii TaxID=2077276 RepID=A0A9W7CSV3_9STRA|nr:unnamed protein product [Phytophthora lilii]
MQKLADKAEKSLSRNNRLALLSAGTASDCSTTSDQDILAEIWARRSPSLDRVSREDLPEVDDDLENTAPMEFLIFAGCPDDKNLRELDVGYRRLRTNPRATRYPVTPSYATSVAIKPTLVSKMPPAGRINQRQIQTDANPCENASSMKGPPGPFREATAEKRTPAPMTADAPAPPARTPPPPVPTAPPVVEPAREPAPEPPAAQQAEQPEAAAASPAKHKHRGLMRAIGGLFKRKCSDADDATAPSDSEASQRRTSRWSRWSHRQSLPEAPLEVAAVAVPEAAPIHENEAAASPPHTQPPPAKKAKKADKPKKDKKPKPPSLKAKQSPTDPSGLLAADSSDESEAEPQRVSFLFFGGSDADSTFKPDLRPSDLDDLHENEIRPSLQAKMPLFFSPPLVENLRRSSILPDPKEYEF